MIAQAKSMPLSSSLLLNKDELVEVARQIRESIPEEIKQARLVVKDREELIAKGSAKADDLLADAREEQARMLSKEGVVQAAEEEASRILETAREEAQAAQLEAEDFVDAKLAQFEFALGKIVGNNEKVSKAMKRTIKQIESGREKLRESSAHPAEALAPEGHEEGPESLGPKGESQTGGGSK
jgi:hypothetical protein